MSAPYTAQEEKVKSEEVRDAIYEARTGAKDEANRLWGGILQVRKDLAHDVRYLWIAVIVLFVGCVTLTASTVKSFNNVTEDMLRVREGFSILGLHDAPADASVAKLVAVTPAPTPTPAPTATPDPWKEVRDCQIEAVMFQVASGNIENEYQKQWKAYGNRYEIWAVALFSNADPEKYRTDHWNNELLYQISGDSMPFESLAKLPVRVFSENGMIGDNDYWTGGAVRLTHPVNCKTLTTKADRIIWTDTSALKLLTEVKGSRGEGTTATSRFYIGGPMTDEEVRAMTVAAQHSEGWTNWVGSGFLGYGSSSGNFEILDDGTLTWGYFFNGPLVDMGVKIPVNTEVVVVTSVNWTGYVTPWLKAQRFIWTNVQGVGGGWHMIEQEPADISQSALDYLLNK